MTDRGRDDIRTEKILLSHTLTMRGSDVASLNSAQWFRRRV